MSLAPGTRLGPYEIVSPLGAGGMGEVYRAKDSRLGREVAVKVLPQDLSSSPEIRARFEREAKTVSSLNHPNICTLHDVGREGEIDYLVMELIEGETLAVRLMTKGALPLADVLKYGSQIADALDRAHRAGVMHRDLKPGNIMLTKSGAKLMDFGLARATGLGPTSEMTSSPTVASPLTAEGTILGTLQYMAPEQLEGLEADARADLWALGCVLHEMATGKRAFDGKSQASLITSIMGGEAAPISQISSVAPSALDRLVASCLVKDPADRIQSAHDVKLQLQWIASGGSPTGAPAAAALPPKRRARSGPIAWAAIAAGLVICAAAGYFARGLSAPRSAGVADVTYKPLTFEEGFIFAARFAPDGRTVVYSADWDGRPRDLFVTSLDSPDFRPMGFPGSDLLGMSRSGELAILSGSTVTGGNPYIRKGTLARASMTGGATRSELDGVRFADFGSDGAMAVVRDDEQRRTIEYPVGQVLIEVPVIHGRSWANESGMVAPRVSPTGAYVAVFDTRSVGAYTVKVFDRSGKPVVTSPPFVDWWDLAWAPGNELWYSAAEAGGRQTTIFGLDLSGRRRVVYRAPGSLTLHDISPQGDLLGSIDHILARIEMVDGNDAAPVDRSWREGGTLAAFSSTHAVLLNQMGDSGGPRGSVYVWQPDAREPIRIADGSGQALSQDGSKAIVVSIETPTKVSVVPTGAGRPSVLDLGPVESVTWAGWLPDGRLVLELVRPGKAPVAYALSPEGRDPVVLLPEGTILSGNNLISPDGSRVIAVNAAGSLVACTIATPGCRPVPGAQDDDQVAGWSADGKSLFVYRGQQKPVQVDRLDVASGTRTAWKTLHPVFAAVSGLGDVFAAPDGALVYGYSRTRSELYVIKGLK
jgi:DNA-binding beta-propeller fold protein YncE